MTVALLYFARLLVVAVLFVAVLMRVTMAALKHGGVVGRPQDAPNASQTIVYAALVFAVLLTFLK